MAEKCTISCPDPTPRGKEGLVTLHRNLGLHYKFMLFRQEFQTANEIVENSILSLLGARRYRKFSLELRISFHA